MGDQVFAPVTSLRIRYPHPAGAQPRAWSLAKTLNRSRAYDTPYPAAAAMYPIQVVDDRPTTGERRLRSVDQVGGRPPVNRRRRRGF